MSRFLLELGPQYATRGGESIIMQKRLEDEIVECFVHPCGPGFDVGNNSLLSSATTMPRPTIARSLDRPSQSRGAQGLGNE
jgi:hypothetical protein